MRFTVLGPQPDNLPPKERVVLVTLLLHAGKVVPVSALAMAIWDDNAPPSARNTIQGHVKRLRRLLGPDGGRIVTKAPGYLIDVRSGELDLREFTRLRAEAADAVRTGAWDHCSALLTEALSLWHTDPLADVPSAYLRRAQSHRLTELRHEALEARIEADLHRGRHEAVIAELRGLVVEHPFRERLWEQLMLALYRAGRQSDALDAYTEARRLLSTELGIEPSAGLRELQARILDGDPALAPEATGRARRVSRAAPRQLPADLPDFTGRNDEFHRLRDLLVPRARTIPVAVVSGPGGIGKTALAVHMAHETSERFPDGQLFVELGGANNPAAGADVLARLLRDLGVPEREIPDGEDERGARFRTAAAGKKLLLVLDDAPDAARVRVALPGTGGSAVIVTSRSSLADLAGAEFCRLSPLSLEDSRELLVTIAGRGRTSADPSGTNDIVTSCAGLPLAIRIAGSKLATTLGWTASQLGRLIADEQRRLSVLAVGDTAVRASFEVSYLALPGGDPSPARVFRLFGLTGLSSLSLPALAALADAPAARTAEAITALLDAHLLETPEPDWYSAHDLLRIYAAERADDDEPAFARREALRRLCEWYLHTLCECVSKLGTIDRAMLSDLASPSVLVPEIRTPADALSWLRNERANLIRLVGLTSEHGFDDLCWMLAAMLRCYFEWTGRHADQIEVGSIGLAAAERTGHRSPTAMLLNVLGSAYWKLGQLDRAVERYSRALELRLELGDRQGVAALLSNLGLVEIDSGKPASAMERFTDALAINRELRYRIGEAYCLHNLGSVHQLDGHADEALAYYQQALAIRVVDCPLDEQAGTMHSIGELLLSVGRTDEAMDYLRRGLAICQEIDLSYGEGMTLTSLGDGYLALGKTAEAISAWQRAQEMLSNLGAASAAREAQERLTNVHAD